MFDSGTIPGPTISADWGDTVVVHITNKVCTPEKLLLFHS